MLAQAALSFGKKLDKTTSPPWPVVHARTSRAFLMVGGRKKLVTRLSGYYCLENKTTLEHEGEL